MRETQKKLAEAERRMWQCTQEASSAWAQLAKDREKHKEDTHKLTAMLRDLESALLPASHTASSRGRPSPRSHCRSPDSQPHCQLHGVSFHCEPHCQLWPWEVPL